MKKAHFILQDWPSHLAIVEIEFKTSIFWIRLCGLPPRLLNLTSAKELANMFGRFVRYGGGFGNVLRMKIKVKINRALRLEFFVIEKTLLLCGYKKSMKI